MKNLTKLALALVALVVLGTACAEHPGFKKDKQGFYYKFHVQNKKEMQPQLHDVVEMTYTLRTSDSILIDNVPLYEMIIESLFEGDIYAAIQKMHLGDSATFIMDGDTFFHYFMGQPFPFDNKNLYFDLKLNNIIPKEEFERQQIDQQQQYEEMMEDFRLSEDDLINEYLETNNIKVKPTASGLYFIQTTKGTGKPIKAGSRVAIHYTGKFLDGTVFDSSDGGEPIEIPVGQGYVIPGWEEALLMMRGGDRATVLIPSRLGYGSRGAGYVIPPYTPLVFDMEVVSVE
jgi:FKBP-type peptidyl-prolyl cis-trans isomerase